MSSVGPHYWHFWQVTTVTVTSSQSPEILPRTLPVPSKAGTSPSTGILASLPVSSGFGVCKVSRSHQKRIKHWIKIAETFKLFPVIVLFPFWTRIFKRRDIHAWGKELLTVNKEAKIFPHQQQSKLCEAFCIIFHHTTAKKKHTQRTQLLPTIHSNTTWQIGEFCITGTVLQWCYFRITRNVQNLRYLLSYNNRSKARGHTKTEILKTCSADRLSVSAIRRGYSLKAWSCSRIHEPLRRWNRIAGTPRPFLPHFRRKTLFSALNPHVPLKSLVAPCSCLKSGCTLEATCLPALSWGTHDLKGSRIPTSFGIATREQTAHPRAAVKRCCSGNGSRCGSWSPTEARISVGSQCAPPPGTAPRHPWSVHWWSCCRVAWLRTANLCAAGTNTTWPLAFRGRGRARLGAGSSWAPSSAFTLSSGFWLLQGLELHPRPHPPTSVPAYSCKTVPVILSEMSTFLLHNLYCPFPTISYFLEKSDQQLAQKWK